MRLPRTPGVRDFGAERHGEPVLPRLTPEEMEARGLRRLEPPKRGPAYTSSERHEGDVQIAPLED